ncbi:MAG: radical SAM protein, partial [Planctomycetes bacterium]|nr:radical SAM protein [Planctomycetota bacterium]
VCPENAICLEVANRIDRKKCTLCKKCVDECPSTALKSIGRYYPVAELVEILKGYYIFYETSQGGVTFSGGEPTLYVDYVGEVIKGLKKDNIHVAIQTAGTFDVSEFRSKLLPYVDLIFYDIKFIDPVVHKKYTGQSNSRILNNFLQLAGEQLVPRVPLIPGITTVTENLIGIADLIKRAGCTDYQLLAYNSGGIQKRSYTGKAIPSSILDITPGIEMEQEWKKLFADRFSV